MKDNNPTGNPIFDLWLDNQQQFLEAQKEWVSPKKSIPDNPFMDAGFLDRSMKTWQRCEEQYLHWMNAAENWVGNGENDDDAAPDENFNAQALNYLINPTTFMKSGYEMMDQAFRKLVNGPEFADIGTMEKKVLKSGQDWQKYREASHNFQEVISGAWLRAYQHFSDEMFDRPRDEPIDSEAMLKRWLQLADEELVTTLRSPDFLDAQRELFAAGTAYKLRYREFAEMWCESHTIPTRSEVDDLHKLIYELRREVRSLKKKVEKKEEKQETAVMPEKAAPKKKTPAKKKAPEKKLPPRKNKAPVKEPGKKKPTVKKKN